MMENGQILGEPFNRIFADRGEADWAFDLLRETVRGLKAAGPHDPRLAVTLVRAGERVNLHLNFGAWRVIGFREPGQTVELTLLAERAAADERLADCPFDRREGTPEVRSYQLPLTLLRPMTAELRAAYQATLNHIADRFRDWRRAIPWKRHHPEIVEALFDPLKRAALLAGGLAQTELQYERYFTAFYHDVSETPAAYTVEGEPPTPKQGPIMQPTKTTDQETEIGGSQPQLAAPFDRIFTDRAEAEWAFELLAESCRTLSITGPEDERFAVTLPRRYSGLSLHLYVGDWLVLAFRDPQSMDRIRLPFLADRVTFDPLEVEHDFAQDAPEGQITGYGLPLATVRPWPEELRPIYEETLAAIAARFREYGRSPWRESDHVAEIAAAIFDPAHRERLLSRGLDQAERHLIGVKDTGEIDRILSRCSLPCLAEATGLPEATLSRWVRAIERKGQAILYGPPGTGKTHLAEKLAGHLVGAGGGFWEIVQFHPAYAYEDFIQGIRPHSEADHLSYPLVPGRFLEFCRRAENRSGRCVLIIDEINRANLARVFGELMYLLEYREREIPLAAGGLLRIPDNVRLIGTMNTADRSIALVDHALRRRFAFLALYPNYDALRHYHRQTGFPVERLIETLRAINRAIDDRHYEVGITFFLRDDLADHLADIWQMEIEPYLEEYFFDRPEQVEDFRWAKIAAGVLP